MDKKEKGQYFTTTNPFGLSPFQLWLKGIANYEKMSCIEPFAGSNNIISMVDELGIKLKWTSYDIDPQNPNIIKNDSILNFPLGYDIAITNPPYLAKNSAKRMNLKFPNTHYDDLYKLSLDVMIKNCRYVAAIIPESFITAGLFHNQLVKVISLEMKMFEDTECPVCLAIFDNTIKDSNFEIYKNEEFKMNYLDLMTKNYKKINIVKKSNFYDPQGLIGLIAIDNTKTASIKFCEGSDIDSSKIKKTSRSITRISLDPCHEEKILKIGLKFFIEKCNEELNRFREDTSDLLLTSFKGLRSDGKYRRRLSFDLAKNIIEKVLHNL